MRSLALLVIMRIIPDVLELTVIGAFLFVLWVGAGIAAGAI